MNPRHASGQLSGTVRIRLSGEPADVETAAALITDYDGAGLDVLDQSSPRRNRREPGIRVYLAIRITAAGNRREAGR